jgi:hypothetical protein
MDGTGTALWGSCEWEVFSSPPVVDIFRRWNGVRKVHSKLRRTHFILLRKVLQNACIKAKVVERPTLHWLRHSFPTLLVKAGPDIRSIRQLLGYASTKTTEMYTRELTKHIGIIISPLDHLDI